jgi:hypothetical protein
MVCVMAENSDMSRDIAYNIHTTLLEAFCLENDIWLIKVGIFIFFPKPRSYDCKFNVMLC